MIRKLKTLGLAFMAVLAMGAVIASAAQATTLTASNFVGEHQHATISASQIGNHTFKFGIREVSCSVELEGTLTGTDETISVTPIYFFCSTKPILGVTFRATVTTEGCTYDLKATEPFPRVLLSVKCGILGNKITIHLYNNADTTHHSPVCTLTFGEFGNQNLATNELINSAAGVNPMDVVLKTTEVPVTTDGTGGVCGGLNQTAIYNGETTIKAISTGAGNPQINLTAVNEA